MSNRFFFIVPMFNASKTLKRMLHSVAGQSHENWHLIVIDDVSSVAEANNADDTIRDFRRLGYRDQITSIWNTEKKWEVANVLTGLDHADSDDLVCRLDADDWLTDLDTLAIIDNAYTALGCDALWTAHRWGFSDKNISGPMPDNVDPYKYPWVSSHLKTWRKSLSEGVNDVNYRGEDGQYIRRAGDQAVYLPVLKRAQKRVFLPRVCYHYTIDDVPETYQTTDARFQRDEALFLRQRGFIE